MATEAALIARIRNELGDFTQPFRTTYRGDGTTDLFDLPATNVSGVVVTLIDNGTATVVPDTDYTIDSRDGYLDFTTAPADGVTVMVEGESTGLFTDAELGGYLHEAALQHNHGAVQRYRYRDSDGFIKYRERPVTLANLPEVEELLVVILATVEALWALSTDASTDVDISTAEGTFLSRSQRYAQIRSQIDLLTEKYLDLSQQLNVGLHRIEVTNLRRVTLRTGRLVPLYVAREFDEWAWPERIVPPIDSRHSEADHDTATPQVGEDVQEVDINLTAGDSFEMELDFEFNLTGSTIQAATSGSAERIGLQTRQYFTVEVTDAVNGIATLSLTPVQTARLPRFPAYDVQVTHPDGTILTYIKGRIFVAGQITPDGSAYIPEGEFNAWNVPGWVVNQ